MLLGIFGLLLLVVLVLQIPPVQRWIGGKASAFMSEKTGTRFEIGKVDLDFPLGVSLEGIYIEDQLHDTLIAGNELSVGIDPIALFSNQIQVEHVNAEGLVAHIKRSLPDSSFNFDFIVTAFMPDTAAAAPADTAAAPAWEVSIGDIELENVLLTYNDQVAGTDADIRLGYLNTELGTFDLEKMHFGIDHIELSRTNAVIVQSKAATSQDTSAAAPLVLDMGRIELNTVKLDYTDKVNAQKFLVDVGKSSIEGDRIDVLKQYVAFKEINISDTKASIEMGAVSPVNSVKTEIREERTVQGKAEWIVKVGNIDLRNNTVRFHQQDTVALPADVLDPTDLLLTGLNVQVREFDMEGTDIKADIRNVSAKDKSGFELKKLAAKLTYGTKGVELAGLDLRTNNSRIGNYIRISYPSLEAIGKNPGEMGINAEFRNTSISVSDIMRLDTAMRSVPALTGNRSSNVQLSGDIKGKVKDLVLDDVQVTTRYSTHVHVDGTIKGLPDINATVFDLNIPKLTTSASDIRSFVPANTIPPSINLPPLISMKGNFKGSLKEFTTNDSIITSFGNASLAVKMDTVPGNTLYTGTVAVNKFNMGKLLKQEQKLGTVTGTIDFNGAGLKPDSMEAIIKGSIKEFTANNYTYKDLALNAIVKDQNIRASATMRDSNLAFALDGNINIKEEQPKIAMKLFLDGADLKDMNFTKEDIKVQGVANIDLEGKDINFMKGTVDVRSVLVIREGKRVAVDTMITATINNNDNTDITIRSSVMSGEIKGGIRPSEIAGALAAQLKQYFDPATAADSDTSSHAQDLTFDIKITDPSLVTDMFMPDLEMSAGTIKGNFDKHANKLHIETDMPRISYKDIQLDSLKILADGNEGTLNYNIGLAEVFGSSFHVNKTKLSGNVNDGKMSSVIDVVDKDKKGHQLMLSATTSKVENVYRLHFDSVMMNNIAWTVSPDNYIAFQQQGPFFHNVRWEHGENFLAVNSTAPSKMDIDLSGFDLALLTGIVAKDKPIAGGTASGKIALDLTAKEPVFTSDLRIKNFNYRGDTLGVVSLKADNINQDRYNIALTVHERGNDINIAGFFDPDAKENAINFDLVAKEINLASLREFTMGQLTNLTGKATATMKITGTAEDPDVTGEILFKEAGFRPAYLNSYLAVNNEKIRLDKYGIYFDSFVLIDTLGNKAQLRGAAYTTDFRDYRFDLDLDTRNFLVLNTSSKNNELYYGTAIVDSRIKVRGSNTRPIVEVTAKLNKGSALTFVVPEQVLAEVDREGVVEFVDFNKDLNTVLNSDPVNPDSVVAPQVEIDLTANVMIDEETEFKIVVDPRTGDSLYVRGSSTFSLGIDPSGKISLIGSYDIVEGSYQLSFGNLVRKTFFLERGSRISWSGDPIAATLDLKAVHRVRTSPADLISDQVTNLSSTDMDRIRQQLQFLVRLNMTGRLLTPKIDFDIDLPPDQRDALNGTVYTRLLQLNEQESELNQQVFALIILNRFLPQNPLDAQGGSTSAVATAARGSASKILTQQLNDFTSDYIHFVDVSLSLDSYQDEIAGQPQGITNLQVDVRKEAFDERLRIDMGGNMQLEGQQQQAVTTTNGRTADNSAGDNTKKNDLAADVSVEYKLTRDGRYRLRGLRRTGYGGVFEGRVTETGIGVIFARDYNRFRELFRKPKEEETFKEIK